MNIWLPWTMLPWTMTYGYHPTLGHTCVKIVHFPNELILVFLFREILSRNLLWGDLFYLSFILSCNFNSIGATDYILSDGLSHIIEKFSSCSYHMGERYFPNNLQRDCLFHDCFWPMYRQAVSVAVSVSLVCSSLLQPSTENNPCLSHMKAFLSMK